MVYRKFVPILLLVLCLFVSCKKDKGELYGVSIDASKMVNTPAEVFSLQQIALFGASNNFTLVSLQALSEDSLYKEKDFAYAPLYMIYTMSEDTAFSDYIAFFEKHYKLTSTDREKREQMFLSLSSAVKNIDSTIQIGSSVVLSDKNNIHIEQSLYLKTHYDNVSVSHSKDNVFSVDMITMAGEFPFVQTSEEMVAEISLGNGNYVLDIIQPRNRSLDKYLSGFDEKKYTSILRNLENRKINLSIPAIDIDVKNRPLDICRTEKYDSLLCFPKEVLIDCRFKIENVPLDKTSFEEKMLNSNSSKPMAFDRDFVFVVRGKNSNLIMFIGFYHTR